MVARRSSIASLLWVAMLRLFYPPTWASIGNSHMMMNDKNNLQIADLILKWIDENVGKQKVAKK